MDNLEGIGQVRYHNNFTQCSIYYSKVYILNQRRKIYVYFKNYFP